MTSLVWIAAGGTIEAVARDPLDLVGYGASGRRTPPEELLAGLPGIERVADVRVVPWADPGGGQLPPSHAWTFADLRALAVLVRDAARGADGVVVTCGTNGLEETAWFLDLVLDPGVPVVVTGAMRPDSAPGRDGPGNLLGAFRVAADRAVHGLGVLVVLDDLVLPARDAAKTATYRRGAFQAPEHGPLGFADADGRVVLRRLPPPRGVGFALDAVPAEPPRVDVVVSYLGADSALVDAAVAAGARGIVHAGFGAGHPAPAERAALARAAAAGVVVCQATRVATGRVVPYRALEAAGFVASGDLSPWKARILLSLALSRGERGAALQAVFDAV
ncbi:asparaginase [Actinocorallia sp. A-T 12471]|uniref:asparaginase n=1 Tax=Actinocorallia sp. A-T 12471 TaxID=3089813 RepID=UPI0029CC5DE8|nr:asparaginase [Actinocorallia sp. A-T 12471]MDX6741072.1 asparaginase [Actinocorallia sp. A-T 12471]